MTFRSELMPPALDEAKIEKLAELASDLEEALAGTWIDDLLEFNRMDGTNLEFADFQGISAGADSHRSWVRRHLLKQTMRPVADISLDELVEMVRRGMPSSGQADYELYLAIFEANVPRPSASNLTVPGTFSEIQHQSRPGRFRRSGSLDVDSAATSVLVSCAGFSSGDGCRSGMTGRGNHTRLLRNDAFIKAPKPGVPGSLFQAKSGPVAGISDACRSRRNIF